MPTWQRAKQGDRHGSAGLKSLALRQRNDTDTFRRRYIFYIADSKSDIQWKLYMQSVYSLQYHFYIMRLIVPLNKRITLFSVKDKLFDSVATATYLNHKLLTSDFKSVEL